MFIGTVPRTISLKPEEIIEQIGYLKKLIDQTRIRAAIGYPHFLLWGVIWIFGYLAAPWIPGPKISLVWLILCIAGLIGSFIIGRISRRGKITPPLLRQLTFLSITIAAAAGLCYPFVIQTFGDKISTIYWPFWVGVIYVANGIFIGKQLIWIGLWLVFEVSISLLIPMPYFYYWLALAGGGSFLLTGFILRKQVKSHG